VPKQLNISINRNTWKHACNFCSDIMKKERLFCNDFSQVMKRRCTTMNLLANVKAWSGTHAITQDKEIQKYVFCQQSDVDTVLGPKWAHPQDHNQIINGTCYCAMLGEKLKPTIHS
jgi:hypothetical protein